ncbi:MAG TPA: cyclic nucleotide-binding domain-containing protein [Candidatus Limnocylindrales bacterium]
MSRAPSLLRAAFRAIGLAWAVPDLRRIQLASAVSSTARWTYLVTLFVLAYAEAGPFGIAIVGLLRSVPTVIGVPLAGAASARFTGRGVLTLTYAGRASIIAVAAAGAALDQPLLVLVLAGLDAVLGTLRRPVQAALLPFVARDPSELVAANVATTFGDSLAAVVGPVVGAGVLVAGGPVAVLALSAVGFVVAASLVTGMSVTGGRVHGSPVSPLAAAGGGVSALVRSELPRLVVIGLLSQVVVRGALNVLVVSAAVEVLRMGQPGVGQLFAALGLGGLVGAVVAGAAVGPDRLIAAFVVGLAGWALPLAVIGLTIAPPVVAAMLLLAGVSGAALEVAGWGLLQRALPAATRSSGLAVYAAGGEAGLGLGAVVAPLLIEGFGVQGSFLVCAVWLAATAAILAPGLISFRRELAARTSVVVALRRVPLLAPLSLHIVEELGSAAEPREYGPGELLMREGASGDRFHAITEGKVDVLVGERRVAVLGPGDGVGEIALLRDVPRTATVRARTRVRTLAIDGPPFVAAVTDHPLSAAAATALVDRRIRENRAAPEPASPR